MKQVLRFNKVIKSIIITGDLCILNAVFITVYHMMNTTTLGITFANSLPQLSVLLNLVYLLCNYSKGVVLHRRLVRPDHIIMRAVRNTFFHAVVFISLISLADFGNLSARFFILFYSCFLITLIVYRLLFRHLLKAYRRRGGNSRTVILVGSGENMIELHHELTDDPTSGFNVVGYFADTYSTHYPDTCRYLGQPSEVVSYLEHNNIEHVYCGLTSSHSKEIVPIINYCEII